LEGRSELKFLPFISSNIKGGCNITSVIKGTGWRGKRERGKKLSSTIGGGGGGGGEGEGKKKGKKIPPEFTQPFWRGRPRERGREREERKGGGGERTCSVKNQ